MNRRWTAPALGLVLALSVGLARPVAAFKQPSSNTGTHATKSATMDVQSTVSGMIKGAPAGKTYTVVSGKRSTAVDASKATIRYKGKFASPNDLKPGTYVRAQGTLNGMTLKAKSVEIQRPSSGNKKSSSTTTKPKK